MKSAFELLLERLERSGFTKEAQHLTQSHATSNDDSVVAEQPAEPIACAWPGANHFVTGKLAAFKGERWNALLDFIHGVGRKRALAHCGPVLRNWTANMPDHIGCRVMNAIAGHRNPGVPHRDPSPVLPGS
jgi:hypothetical protein